MLRLAVFDLDGTLKREPDPYVYLHRRLGTMEAAEAFTAKGLSGEIAYEEWLRLDTGLWTGTPRSVLVRHLNDNPYLPGARETVHALKAMGVTVAIVSSGLLLHAEQAVQDLGIDLAIGNEIHFDGDGEDPLVSGRVTAHCVYGGKRGLLAQVQAQLGVAPAETLAVGDTRSDLGLFELAAFRIAVNPNHPDVAAAADLVLPTPDLTPMLRDLPSIVDFFSA